MQFTYCGDTLDQAPSHYTLCCRSCSDMSSMLFLKEKENHTLKTTITTYITITIKTIVITMSSVHNNDKNNYM